MTGTKPGRPRQSARVARPVPAAPGTDAGYTRHGTVRRMRGGKGERVPVFGPLMLAGLDVVEQATGGVLDALLSRSIIIRMSAPREGEEPADVSDPEQHFPGAR